MNLRTSVWICLRTTPRRGFSVPPAELPHEQAVSHCFPSLFTLGDFLLSNTGCLLLWGWGQALQSAPRAVFRISLESPQLLEPREPSQSSSRLCCSSKEGLRKEAAADAPRGGTLEVTLSSALATDEKQDFGTESPGMMLGTSQGAVLARGLGQRNKNHSQFSPDHL